MKHVLIARLRNYTDGPPEEYVWDFDDELDEAWESYETWSAWMAQGLWNFRSWGHPGMVVMIKPGASWELDLRTKQGRS